MNWQEALERHAQQVEAQWRTELFKFVEEVQKPNGFAHAVECKALGLVMLEREVVYTRKIVDQAKTKPAAEDALRYLEESEAAFQRNWMESVRAHNSSNPVANALADAKMEADKRFLPDIGRGLYEKMRLLVRRAAGVMNGDNNDD